jgi:hypothetical protein
MRMSSLPEGPSVSRIIRFRQKKLQGLMTSGDLHHTNGITCNLAIDLTRRLMIARTGFDLV